MEALLVAFLNPLFNNEVYWLVLPDGYVIDGPVCVVSQLGGKAGRYVETDAVPDHKHARVQIVVWSKDQLITGPLARSVEDAMVTGYNAEPMGAPINVPSEDLKLFGSQQQFSFWYPDP